MGACNAKKNSSNKDKFDNIIIEQKNLVEAQGQKFKDCYSFSKFLGKGAFGEVRLATNLKNNQTYAVKMINKKKISKEEEESILSEIQIMINVDHPNIIKIYKYFNESDFLYIVMECCYGGELFEKEITLSEKNLAILAKKILTAINYCHKKNIVHRDLKPENILYTSKEKNADIKIVDWGLSCFYKKNKSMKELVGTPLFMAPEVMNQCFNEKCDIWAIGVILYMVLGGVHPFLKKCRTMDELQANIKTGVLQFNECSKLESISNSCKDFIRTLVTVDEKKRVSAEQALQHPWIKKISTNQEFQANEMTKTALSRFQQYQVQNKIQKVTWTFFTSLFLNDELIQEVKKAFLQLDKNNDGYLSKEELQDGFQQYLSVDKPSEEIEAILKQIDINQNGKIDYNEFLQAAVQREQIINKENIKKAFDLIDIDQNGQISVQEYQQLFCSSKIPEKIWQEMFSEVDDDGDKQISFEEFQKIIFHLGEKLQMT